MCLFASVSINKINCLHEHTDRTVLGLFSFTSVFFWQHGDRGNHLICWYIRNWFFIFCLLVVAFQFFEVTTKYSVTISKNLVLSTKEFDWVLINKVLAPNETSRHDHMKTSSCRILLSFADRPTIQYNKIKRKRSRWELFFVGIIYGFILTIESYVFQVR